MLSKLGEMWVTSYQVRPRVIPESGVHSSSFTYSLFSLRALS